MADLSTIKPTVRTIQMLHPGTSALLGIEVDLVSIDDPKLKQLRRRIDNQSQKLGAKGKAFDSDELNENTDELAFTAIDEWRWTVDADGEAATFEGEVPTLNRATAFRIFKALPWFRAQIVKALNDEEAFFKKSAQN